MAQIFHFWWSQPSGSSTIIGGYIVALWLTLIALVLIFTGNHFDVAVRDLVMAIAALSLVKLSE
ncbi:MAG: hypothetical protein NXH90_12660 [Flavobacteriaceae bacterium]|nr:hypothetical protein [Flavobacteriaceae bacterium]